MQKHKYAIAGAYRHMICPPTCALRTDIEKYYEMVINGLIVKPFNRRELGGIISAVPNTTGDQTGF